MSFKKILLMGFMGISFCSSTPTLAMENTSNLSAIVSKLANKEVINEILTGSVDGLFNTIQLINFVNIIKERILINQNNCDSFMVKMCMGLIRISIFKYLKDYINKFEFMKINPKYLSISKNRVMQYSNIRHIASIITGILISKAIYNLIVKFDDHSLNKFKKFKLYLKFDKLIRNGIINKEEQCNICQENNDENSVILNCNYGHQYHKECIKPWLIENMQCPTCRQQFE